MSRLKKNNQAHPPWAAQLGTRLRAIRRERELSLAAVSKRTGISTSFLSLLESGRTDVSLGRLLPLLELYGLSAAEVLEWDGVPGDRVIRADEGKHLSTVAKGIELYLVAPDRNRPFLPLVAVFEPGAKMRAYSQHPGDEFLFLLEGSLRIEFRQEPEVLLEVGDAIFISGRRPHRFAALGDAQARALVVTTERFSA